MATIANQRLISIRNIIIYLEIKFLPNRRIFVFWRPFWFQNGHHSKPTMDINSQHHNLLGNQISSNRRIFVFWHHFGFKMAAIANQRWISIRNIIIYLETKCCPNRKILYFGGHFGFKMATIANQNGRHMVQHVLLPVNIHFQSNLFIFEYLTIFKIFILAAILKWRPF